MTLISNKNYYVEVAQGNINNPTTRVVHKFGRNPDIDSGPETVYMGSDLYVWQTTAQVINIVSSEGNDDGSPTTNTGAQTIIIEGLDGSFNEVTDTVVLEGTSSVQTTQAFMRISRAYVDTVGTYHNNNEGVITGTFDTTGNKAFAIDEGIGQTQIGFYTVPSGKTAYMVAYSLSVDSNKTANIVLFQTPNADDTTQPFSGAERAVLNFDGVSGHLSRELWVPIKFVEKTDIEFRVQSVSANNTSVSVDFGLLIVDN